MGIFPAVAGNENCFPREKRRLASGQRPVDFQEDLVEAKVSIWQEAFFAADVLLLHSSPVYYGLGVPRGDGSAVILIPGFLGTDGYLSQFHTWALGSMRNARTF